MTTPQKTRWTDSSAYRWAMVILGWMLVVSAPLVSWLPGPGGLALFIIGLGVILKHSLWAKKRYSRLSKLHPEYGRWADWALRRSKVQHRPPFPDIKRDIMYLCRRDDIGMKLP
ncbi:hypothetical protein [Sphingorhabdus lacus]|uniref:DUF454 family protein n=1 Tax=Sphingorhabdus lacus TaxID=392610 RepID=A0A6I6L1J7_9SPHN|nr:hypothetical protein [Sphingorhabdus lacus]QGY79420.1 hypothetical protein EUU25_01540 [Sphingorhabdus lacus]